jgi:hypothetical protein
MWREEEEADVSNYFFYLKEKRGYCKPKDEDFALEKTMDLLLDRLQNEWIIYLIN